MLLIYIFTDCGLKAVCVKRKKEDQNKNRIKTANLFYNTTGVLFLASKQIQTFLKGKKKKKTTNKFYPFYCEIIINFTTWIENPSYEYTSLHIKFITKEKQVVGVPTKYYIQVGKTNKQTNKKYCRYFKSK